MINNIKDSSLLQKAAKAFLFVVIIGSFVSNIFFTQDFLKKYENQVTQLETENETQTDAVSTLLSKLKLERDKNIALENSLSVEQENNNMIKSQVETISSSVGVLEKISKTDSELLKKYSKIYFLNENYTPKSLTPINPSYLIQKEKANKILTEVSPHLEKLLEDSTAAGLDLKVLSSYRSFAEQASLKTNYKTTYGSGANKFSADQGYSEHQLGTTIDFNISKNATVLTGFEKTNEYKWLQENAYKYGFVLSYPKENTFYIFEPWHWRYVGVELATKIHNDNTYFYSMDQRSIDTYLVNLFD